jgi:AcrR family transcriptional regulator
MPEARTRDRAETEKAIVSAAKSLIAKQGFQKFGVNALAREAGCDKQLIYRYFDGLDGVVDAIGEDLTNWVRDRLRPLLALGACRTYPELMERLALGLLQAYRDDPLMQKLKAWEFAEPSPQLARITATRAKGLAAWMHEARGAIEMPKDVDAPAINALIIAAIENIVLTAATSETAYGMPMSSESDWERVRGAIRLIIQSVYVR